MHSFHGRGTGANHLWRFEAAPSAQDFAVRWFQPQLQRIVETFSSGQKAKEYLIGRIVSEAELQGLSLSETECKMMYFSETAWTLPDISEVNEVFEQDYDQRSYEAKIGNLAKRARDRARLAKELKTWNEAVRTLKREDHYLLILLHAPTESTDSKLVDALKLLGTAIALIVLLFGIIFAAETMKDHLH